MDIAQRIAQFEAMVRPEADPNNDMAWFSLGNAYAQSGRHADAAKAYLRSVEINPTMSKGFQLAGQALIDAGDAARAGEVLTRGFISAAELGNRLPQQAMGELLKKLGLPLPQVKTAKAVEEPTLAGAFVCSKTGRPGTKMYRPPFKGPVGAWIQENISRETFLQLWLPQGTKVINELRLDLSREQDAETYDRYMREFLGIDDALFATLSKAGSKSA